MSGWTRIVLALLVAIVPLAKPPCGPQDCGAGVGAPADACGDACCCAAAAGGCPCAKPAPPPSPTAQGPAQLPPVHADAGSIAPPATRALEAPLALAATLQFLAPPVFESPPRTLSCILQV